MLILRGPLALSHFRLERLLTKINDVVPQVNSISAEYIHFVDLEEGLTKPENAVLSDLLNYGSGPGSSTGIPDKSDKPLILVVPKSGTISPWSRKATDIIHHCNLNKIRRIERGIAYTIESSERLTWGDEQAIAGFLYHAKTESVFYRFQDAEFLFKKGEPKPEQWVDILGEGRSALVKANRQLGLNLSDTKLDYFLDKCKKFNRNPSNIECASFLNLNFVQNASKLFNIKWLIDGTLKTQSLFSMIANTVHLNPRGILSAYQEKTAIIEEGRNNLGMVMSSNLSHEPLELGNDIELGMLVSTGRGAKPKAGITGWHVSHLRMPGFHQPWEIAYGKPKEMISALDMMLEAPVRAGKLNNEFGHPNIGGYFRTYEQLISNKNGKREAWGYHQPIIKTGGIGSVQQGLSQKVPCLVDKWVAVLGGGQHANAEMQRRCLETIQACAELSKENPIDRIHLVEQSGLGYTLLNLINSSKLGGFFELRDIPVDDNSLSPVEIWTKKGIEQYVVIVDQRHLETFKSIASRECCPLSVIGKIISEPKIHLQDKLFNNNPMDCPTAFLFEKMIPKRDEIFHESRTFVPFDITQIHLEEAIFRLLRLPCIADKSFLITIIDRTVTGLVARDQMVGPWQVPVSDCAVTVSSFNTYQGEAMAIGERSPLGIINPAASARMAVGEAITNIVAAQIGVLSDIRLSADWSGAFQTAGEKANLFDAVQAIGLEFCPTLGIAISVNQSLSATETVWFGEGEEKRVTPPMSVMMTAFASVMDVRSTLTPQLSVDHLDTLLVFIDLSGGKQRLGGSALAHVFNQMGDESPDVDNPNLLKSFFTVIQQLHLECKILAYHDRSDGGLFVTLCEMAFASHVGLQVDISDLGPEPKSVLFNEELGAVIQIRAEDVESVLAALGDEAVSGYVIGTLDEADHISIVHNEVMICSYARIILQQTWSETSFHLQSLRDNPRCAKKQFESAAYPEDPGLNVELTFNPEEDVTLPYINLGAKPRIAILREQGTHGHIEMAAAFDKANFECVDVHMSDLQNNTRSLAEFKGLAVCSGFSFGDVLGAGLGWAKRILYNEPLREQFAAFFNNPETFTLGLSNGCQMLAALKSIIPGTKLWPSFAQNYSEQFEARLCLVEIQPTNAVLLEGMAGSRLLVPVAHKEGRVVFTHETDEDEIIKQGLVAVRYVDNWGRKTKTYPANPNGSLLGITGLTTPDGRILCMMPNPDRVFRTVQHSWHPGTWGEDGPWLRLFRNARKWVG